MTTQLAPPPPDSPTATEPPRDVDPPRPEDQDSPERARREWTMIAVGLSGLVSLIALILSFVALSGASSSSPRTMSMPMTTAAPAAAATPAAPPQSVTMSFRSDIEHGRKGPDGTWHDAGLPAVYSVRAGSRVRVTLLNYDSSPHSFTAPGLGVDQIVAGGSPANPGRATFTYTAPSKPGRYDWWCKFPCDPWAMNHVGYMRGYVTVRT